MNKVDKIKFIDISKKKDFIRYADQITGITKRSEKELFYLLYMNKKSKAFCILYEDQIVGFQGWIYKPMTIDKNILPSYRSEFTIAVQRLRGTGIFPKFYKYTMDVIRNNHREVYFWGETPHKGWKKFGFRVIKRYSFYQIFSKTMKRKLRKPEMYNSKGIRIFSILFSVLNPIRFVFSKKVEILDKISFEEFNTIESKRNRFKLRLYLDEVVFRWRYLDNDFNNYLFVKYRESLLIIKDSKSIVEVVDVYVKNSIEYLFLISYLTRKYKLIIVHGNFYAMYRTPYFWLNLISGFIPFVGGGSFVEYNEYAKRISWRDIPLLESWGFGV